MTEKPEGYFDVKNEVVNNTNMVRITVGQESILVDVARADDIATMIGNAARAPGFGACMDNVFSWD